MSDIYRNWGIKSKHMTEAYVSVPSHGGTRWTYRVSCTLPPTLPLVKELLVPSAFESG
jgi:hypothetical protein